MIKKKRRYSKKIKKNVTEANYNRREGKKRKRWSQKERIQPKNM